MNTWYTNDLTARRSPAFPQTVTHPSGINDTTSSVVVGAQPSGYSFMGLGSNTNRMYVLIQNNTTVNISLAAGNAASPTGILLLPGGYYERQIYTFTSAIYITLLGASAANDYVTLEEGSIVTQV